jgi:hypothetical protein
LIEAAGVVGIDLGNAVGAWWAAKEAGDAEKMQAAERLRSELFAKATGGVYGVMAEARTYSTRIEQEAKSDEAQVKQLLGLSPQDVSVFLEHVRIEAVQEVLTNCYEKFVVRPEHGDTKSTLELWLNRRGEIIQKEREIPKTR